MGSTRTLFEAVTDINDLRQHGDNGMTERTQTIGPSWVVFFSQPCAVRSNLPQRLEADIGQVLSLPLDLLLELSC